MNRALNLSVLCGIFLALTLSFQNCSKVDFTSATGDTASTNDANGDNNGGNNGGPNPGNDTNCRVDLVNAAKEIKVLFLIDTSGSNQGNNGAPGTDMGKVWRLKTINSFINAYSSKSNFYFGFAVFQGSSAKSLLNYDSNGIFTKDPDEIENAIQDFEATRDTGSTPYDAALDVVNKMIKYDQYLKPSQEVGYAVVMISDGSPTNASYIDPYDGMKNLTNDVNSIMSVVPGQISLNTVYLFNENVPTASQTSYLQKIASLGNGAFIEASSQQTLQISDTIQVPRTTCQ